MFPQGETTVPDREGYALGEGLTLQPSQLWDGALAATASDGDVAPLPTTAPLLTSSPPRGKTSVFTRLPSSSTESMPSDKSRCEVEVVRDGRQEWGSRSSHHVKNSPQRSRSHRPRKSSTKISVPPSEILLFHGTPLSADAASATLEEHNQGFVTADGVGPPSDQNLRQHEWTTLNGGKKLRAILKCGLLPGGLTPQEFYPLPILPPPHHARG